MTAYGGAGKARPDAKPLVEIEGLTAPDGSTRSLPLFWDGGKTYPTVITSGSGATDQ